MSVLLNQSSLTDLFNPFVCTQGIGNVAKETEDEVKRHGVKGVKALKDDGVDGSFVVNCKLKDVAPKVFSNIGDRLESYQKEDGKIGGKLCSFENEADAMLLSKDDMMTESGGWESVVSR